MSNAPRSNPSVSLVDNFARQRPEYEAFCQRLEQLVTALLLSEGIEVVQIEARTKTVESLADKLGRKSNKYEALVNVHDLVGLRIITYYTDDELRIADILQRNFDIDESASIRKGDGLQDDQFGYLSSHYIVSLNSSRSDLPEWSAYAPFKAEVQIRTALQHAWAAVSHKLEYKRAVQVPRELRRPLFRLSALFELADEQFSTLSSVRSALDDANESAVQQGDLDRAIDSSTLTAYINQSPRIERFIELANEAGWEILSDDEPSDRVTLDREDLATVLKSCGMDSISSLDEFLRDKDKISRLLEALVRAEKHLNRSPVDSIYDVLSLALIASQKIGAAKKMFTSVFMTNEWPAMEAAMKELGQK